MIKEKSSYSLIMQFILVVISFAAAMVLSVVTLPESIGTFRPDFVALVLIFWCIHRPQFTGIFTAFVVGLLTDTLFFGVLGQHAIAKIAIAYIILKFASDTLVRASAGMQTWLVLVLLVLNTMIISIVNQFTQGDAGSYSVWMAPFTGAILWYLFAWIWHSKQNRRHGIIE